MKFGNALGRDKQERIYARLAKAAYDNGKYERCFKLGRKLGSRLAPDVRTLVAESAYRSGIQMAASDQFRKARERISYACQHSDDSLRRLCHDRLNLIAQRRPLSSRATRLCPICPPKSNIQRPVRLDREAVTPEMDQVHCVAAYRSGWDRQRGDPFSRFIRMVKGGRHRDELEYLADLLAHYMAVHLPGIRAVADSIVPVPTTPSRSAKRGYGIPETLSERVSEATAIPAYTDVVRLERETEDLRYLSRSERRAELEDAFCVAKPEMVGGYSIVIVDDIITHGTTLREIGGTLRAAGARKVFGVVLAHVESSGAI